MTDDTERLEGRRVLRRVVLGGGPWIAVLALTGLATAGAEAALPAVLGATLDGVLGGGSTRWLAWCAALVAVLVAADVADDLAVGAATARSTATLRRAVLGHVLAVGTRIERRFPPGEVVSRLVGSTAEAGRVGPDVVRAAVNLVPAAAAIVALVLIDPWLGLTVLAGVPLLALVLRSFVREASDIATRYFTVQGTIASRLVDALAGARSIAASGTYEREVDRVLEALPELRRHGIGTWYAQARIAAQDALLVPLTEVAVVAVAGVELARGRVTAGEVLAAAQYAVLAMTLTSAVSAVSRLARARAGASRAAELMREPATEYGDATPYGVATSVAAPSQAVAAGGATSAVGGRLELVGVTVRHADRAVLDAVDLSIPPGALVAIVGPSGAGKSVLAAVAGRLIDPDAGAVHLDGTPLQSLPRTELRRRVGYAFERPALLGDTVAEAIAMGVDEPGAGEIVAAARAAQADAFIRRLPRGYANPLAETPLSGGERQRLGLARAFAHAGRVLVLDDVAASLDTVTEHHIGEVLSGTMSTRTRIVVAHRAAIAARADLVVWLDAGRVRAVATHEALWDDAGYRALFEPVDDPDLRATAS